MKKLTLDILLWMGLLVFIAPALQSCNDEPDEANFYSFTGQMASQYLTTNAQYSQFAEIVNRAGLMDQLSAYGHYTCFVPNNDAINKYLEENGKTMSTLSKEDCDTIARTHIVDVIYAVSEMKEGVLPTTNLMNRNLEVKHDVDDNGNAIVMINNMSKVFYELQDDSVENGIMQPVDVVIENSTSDLASLIEQNPKVSLFFQGLMATGLNDKLAMYRDNSYNPDDYEEKIQYITGASIHEVAVPPAEKLYGFTAFVFTDEMLKTRYNITNLQGLFDKACEIYEPTMQGTLITDPNLNLKDENGPLYKFMAYHLLDRNVQGYNMLTVRDDVGVDKSLVNTTEWFTTMLPYSMIKVEKLNLREYMSYGDVEGERYINRCFNSKNNIQGIHVNPTVDDAVSSGVNGIYFYINDILRYDDNVRNIVHNTRIRMDFSAIFPEIMSNNIRMNGDYTKYDNQSIYDDSYKYGKNYYFPDGYLKNVVFNDNNTGGHFIYRRPRANYYSMHGDEMIANGVFDLTFVLPPVPYESEWQIRLGFAPMDASQAASRGIFQIYFDGKAQGIPLNMDERINSAAVYGATSFPDYLSIRENDERRAEDFKILKNKGYYRGPYSVFHDENNNVSTGERFAKQPSTVRKVLCTVSMKPGKDYKLRIRNVSTFRPKEKEAMLDYIELVPKSVYGVTDGDNAEDDL